jgi:hypothetical protein
MKVYVLTDNINVLTSKKELKPMEVALVLFDIGYFYPAYENALEYIADIISSMKVDKGIVDDEKLADDELLNEYVQERFIEGVYSIPGDEDELHKHLCVNLSEYKLRDISPDETELDVKKLLSSPNSLLDIRDIVHITNKQ